MRVTMLNVWFCRIAIVLGWALIIAGFAVIAAEFLLWLRNGSWPRWPLREVVTVMPQVRHYDPNAWMPMHGADRLVDWIGAIPTSLVLLFGGVGLAWNANASLEKTEARLEEARRRTRRV